MHNLYYLAILLLIGLALPLHAQTLVKDINPGPEGMGGEPFEDATVLDGVVYFYALDGTHGSELWRSDGTPDGTYLLKDIWPGPDGSGPYNFVVLGDHLYFEADDGIHGDELWRTDGTEAGTVLVKDIHSGMDGDGDPNSASIDHTFAFGGRIYFEAEDGVHGNELWQSDGTEGGTVMVKDLHPGRSPFGFVNDGSPSSFATYNGSLYFSGCSSAGCELWKTDGTTDGTVLVKDIEPFVSSTGTPDSGFPGAMTEFNGLLYFSAQTRALGYELWRTDGTTDGTVLVKDIFPGSPGVLTNSFPSDLTVFDGALFFFAETDPGSGLWKTDGTEAGTVPVGPTWEGRFRAGSIGAEFDGQLYLFYRDETTGAELWRTDGTVAGTELFVDLYPGLDDRGDPNNGFPNNPLVVGNQFYFTATDEAGSEVWRTDGTVPGTMRLSNINPGEGRSIRGGDDTLILLGDRILFTADDGTRGFELWSLIVNPMDPIHPLRSISKTPGGALITIPAPDTGQVIGVEYTHDLSAESWTDIGSFAEDEGIWKFLDNAPERQDRAQGYYRGFLR